MFTETLNLSIIVSSFQNFVQLSILHFLSRSMYRALNKRATDRPQASAFSFIVLNLADKAVLHFSFKCAGLYKERSTKEATNNFHCRAHLKENHGNTKIISFQFHFSKFSKQNYSTRFYYYRCVTRGIKGKTSQIGKKVP